MPGEFSPSIIGDNDSVEKKATQHTHSSVGQQVNINDRRTFAYTTHIDDGGGGGGIFSAVNIFHHFHYATHTHTPSISKLLLTTCNDNFSSLGSVGGRKSVASYGHWLVNNRNA